MTEPSIATAHRTTLLELAEELEGILGLYPEERWTLPVPRLWAARASAIRGVLAELDEARTDWEWLESKVTLHNGVEVTYLVDSYEVCLTKHDGTTTYARATAETLAAAVRALRLQSVAAVPNTEEPSND